MSIIMNKLLLVKKNIILRISLLFSVIFVIFVIFSSSAWAAGLIKYRCSSESFNPNADNAKNAPWQSLEGRPKCTTKVGADGKGYIYLQFASNDLSNRFGITTVTFTYKAPAAATATPTPTPAAGGETVTPTLTPTPTTTISPTPTPTPKPCADLPSDDRKYDLYPDCRINTFDHAELIKHFSK